MSNSGSGNINNGDEDDDQKLLWKYITKGDKTSGGGGNVRWQCNFCHERKQGTYTRVRAHLLKLPNKGIESCKKVKQSDISEMKKLEEEAKQRALSFAPKRVPLPPNTSGLQNVDSKKRKMSIDSNLISKAFNLKARDQLHAEIARMFYTAGLPFNLARNPYYVSSYVFAANNAISGYLPLGYNMLRTTLLQ
ncbi:hypothetical protein Cni_G26194 [Canna indica]|uniref:BED-type domain-containing protein n=1 Tax=Canna indica TaxID=4628 RepID=A0AAQ3L5M6_9LILI|nr:hypothetical protein Cni_G26194 [Canna indica]